MNGTRAKATALLAVLQLIVMPAWAQSRGVDSLIPARPVGYVNDFAQILDPASAAATEDLVRRLKTATGAELVVVTLPNIGDRDASEVARTIGRRWRVGEKADIGDSTRNAGAILLVVPRQNHKEGTGHVRIETGFGLEGIVTDAAAGQIRDDVMGPDLKAEAYGPAVLKGVQVLSSRIARGYGVSDTMLTRYQPQDNRARGSPVGSNLIPILFFIVFILLASGAGGRRRRRSGVYWGGPWIGGGWG
ncbi:MAG TPA: TPM domain-containing protein, partial [Gemmatimonadales bacterium]|nr:TPM domain-containing protein [Gemmatimonadales bacterium]